MTSKKNKDTSPKKAENSKSEHGKSGQEKPSTESKKAYSRGEGQKLVNERYRKNWDAVFGTNQ